MEAFNILGISITQADIFAFAATFLVPTINGFVTSYLAQKWKRDLQVSAVVKVWQIRVFVGVICAVLAVAETVIAGGSVTLGTFISSVYGYTVAITKYDHTYKGK